MQLNLPIPDDPKLVTAYVYYLDVEKKPLKVRSMQRKDLLKILLSMQGVNFLYSISAQTILSYCCVLSVANLQQMQVSFSSFLCSINNIGSRVHFYIHNVQILIK